MKNEDLIKENEKLIKENEKLKINIINLEKYINDLQSELTMIKLHDIDPVDIYFT